MDGPAGRVALLAALAAGTTPTRPELEPTDPEAQMALQLGDTVPDFTAETTREKHGGR